jgi:hypothetical protein
MSSFVRRIQKRIAKAQGFYRSTLTIPFTEEDGTETTKTIKVIKDSNGDVIGTRWPQVKAPTKKKAV